MVNFPHTNQAITRFSALQQTDNAERRAQQGEMEQRRQIEQQIGVDRAIREGIGSIYAGQPPSAVAPGVAAAPAMAANAAPAAAAQPPATAQMPEIFPPNPGETGSTMPQPAVTPQTAAAAPASAAPMQADVVKPPANVTPDTSGLTAAVTGAPPRPAIGSFTAGAPAASTNAPLMNRLTQTPGAGNAAMQLHGQEQARGQQNARLRQAAEIQAVRSMLNGEPHVAAQIAQQYGINIPQEVIKSASFQREMKNLGATMKGIGINDDVMAASITKEYLAQRSKGADERTAFESAFAASGGPKAKAPKSVWDSTRGAFMQEPTADNPNGLALQPPGTPARQYKPGGGGGGAAAGGPGKQQQYAQWRIDTLKATGMPEAEAQKIVAGGSKQVTQRDVASMATRLMNVKDRMGRPVYKDLNAAKTAAQQALGVGGGDGGGGAGRPGRIRYDNQGNRIEG